MACQPLWPFARSRGFKMTLHLRSTLPDFPSPPPRRGWQRSEHCPQSFAPQITRQHVWVGTPGHRRARIGSTSPYAILLHRPYGVSQEYACSSPGRSAASGGAFRDKNLFKQGQWRVPSFLNAMVLDIPADDLRCDLVTNRTSKIAIFPELPAPEATLHAGELTKDSPGTQTLEPCNDLRDRVSGWEGAKDMDMVWTHLHCLYGDVGLRGHIRQKLPDSLLYLAWQNITAILGRPDQVIQGIIDGVGCASEDHAAIVPPPPVFGSGH